MLGSIMNVTLQCYQLTLEVYDASSSSHRYHYPSIDFAISLLS